MSSATADDIVKCIGTECDSVFHKKCATQNKNLTKTGMCDTCAKNEASPKVSTPKLKIDLKNATAETVLAELNDKLEVLYNMQIKIQELTGTVEHYSAQIKQLFEFKQTSEKKIQALENRNQNLQKVNQALEERIVSLEQKEMETKIEIIGLEQKENENLIDIVANISNELQLNPKDIEEARRVGKQKEGSKRARPVVVTVRSRAVKEQWIEKKKKVRISNDDLLKNGNKQMIYINECLTKHLRDLFWKAKTELGKNFKYIWVQNSRILIKREEKARIHNISKEADINALIGDKEIANNE